MRSFNPIAVKHLSIKVQNEVENEVLQVLKCVFTMLWTFFELYFIIKTKNKFLLEKVPESDFFGFLPQKKTFLTDIPKMTENERKDILTWPIYLSNIVRMTQIFLQSISSALK